MPIACGNFSAASTSTYSITPSRRPLPTASKKYPIPRSSTRRSNKSCEFLLFPAIQSRDPKRIRRPRRFPEAGTMHALDHLRRRWESLDRCRQIRIWATDAGNYRPDLRQHVLEINPVQRPHHTRRLAEIQNAAFSFRTQHTQNLPQAGIVIGQVAETERRSHQIEIRILKGQVESVRFHPTQIRPFGFLSRPLQ